MGVPAKAEAAAAADAKATPSEPLKGVSQKIRSRYPDRIPVIVERAENSNIENIDKRKYLVPNDITVAQFMWIIRKRKYSKQKIFHSSISPSQVVFKKITFLKILLHHFFFFFSGIDLPAEKAIFLFVDKIVPQSSWTMGELYRQTFKMKPKVSFFETQI